MKNVTESKFWLEAVSRLTDGATISIVNGDKKLTSDERGIKFLLELIESDNEILRGASVADKVVGRAAALLFVKGGVKEVYAEVMSFPAEEIFIKYTVDYDYKILTQGIVNRAGDGQCPMEKAVLDIYNPDIAIAVLKEQLSQINKH